MNTIKKIQLTLITAMVLFTMNSCVKDDDWSLPPNNCSDEWQTDLLMADLYTMVNEANGAILSFDEERIIEGYIISSDSTGNFFKTVSIQNDLNNPTYGLQVEMDRTNLFNNFPLGSKIKINLKGLNVGYDRGMLKVGENYVDAAGNTRVGRMAEFKIDGHVAKTCDGIEMATPVVFNNLDEFFNNSVFNTLVTIKNVQFADSELGTTYADAVGSQTLDKKLIDNTGKTLKLRNSGYASFAGDLVPEGSGSITVVVSGYDGNQNGTISPSEYQVYIRDTNDVQFNDPRFGDGGGDPEPPSGDAVPLFAGHDFENWSAFIGGLNSFGIKPYATQGAGAGMNGSASLNIFTDPTTTNGNDYVFTTLATAGLPTSYSKISFYVKGSSTKSVSLNVYKNDGTYYVYNLGSLTGSTTLTSVETNQYTGTINTGGDWALVTLDLAGISDLNVSNTTASLFALKIGKNADYNLNFDNFTVE